MFFHTTLRFLCVLLIQGFLLSCSEQTDRNTFFLRYTGLNTAEGSVVHLWRCHGDGSLIAGKSPIGSSVVTNGEFSFMGKADTTYWYCIELEGKQFYYYPEPGHLTLSYGKNFAIPKSMVSTNEHSLNLQLYQLRICFTDDKMRKLLFSTISNAVGCSLLKQTVVYPDELDGLYNLTNEQMREETPILRGLSTMLDSCKLLETGDFFIDFSIEYKTEKKYLSDIAGKGKSVALFFFTTNSERFPIWNEIERLKKTNPNTQIIVLASKFSNPSTIQFLQNLDSQKQVMVWEDPKPYTQSARYSYRIYNSNYNYVYLFDGSGKLTEKYPIKYAACEEYDKLQTLLLEKIYATTNVNASYKNWYEYKAMQTYLTKNIDCLFRLLDSPLLKGDLTSLSGAILDDLVISCITDAPRLVQRISGSRDNQQMAFYVQQYLEEIKRLVESYVNLQ